MRDVTEALSIIRRRMEKTAPQLQLDASKPDACTNVRSTDCRSRNSWTGGYAICGVLVKHLPAKWGASERLAQAQLILYSQSKMNSPTNRRIVELTVRCAGLLVRKDLELHRHPGGTTVLMQGNNVVRRRPARTSMHPAQHRSAAPADQRQAPQRN